MERRRGASPPPFGNATDPVQRFLALDFLLAVAFAVRRFLVAAAFFPAATRFVDFRAVDLFAVDFLRAGLRAAVFLAAVFLLAGLRAAVLFAVDRFRAAVFFAAIPVPLSSLFLGATLALSRWLLEPPDPRGYEGSWVTTPSA